MKLYRVLFLTLAVSICFKGFSQSLNSNRNDIKLTGIVAEDFNGYLYLFYNDIVDSALVKNQEFYFTGQVDHPSSASIRMKDGISGNLPLYIENTDIQVEVSIAENVVFLNSIEGTKTSKIMTDLFSYFEAIESDPEFQTKIYNRLDTIISQNPRNHFCGMILAEIAMDPILKYEQIYSLFNKLDTTVQEQSEISSIKRSLIKLKNIRIGTTLAEIELPNVNGELVNLRSLNGKFVLVEFWASWCVPCRKTNPDLMKIYDKYRGNGFEIYGVSSDYTKEAWIKAISEDNLKWINTLAEGGFKNDVLQTLGIQYIPSNFLIDKEGKIMAINIKPAELEQTLQQTFN